ncbi:hypothetical protein ES703_66284 [subsurface metagenome]
MFLKCSDSSANAYFPGALGNYKIHDIHHSNSSDHQSHHSHSTQEYLKCQNNIVQEFRALKHAEYT